MPAASGFDFHMVIGDNRVKRSKKCAELGLKFLPDMVYLTQEDLEIAGDTAPNRSRHETRGGTRMERTKYTPKRLLSLLLALIMLLGMLPTAVFAADPVKQYSATSFINDGGARMDVELSCNNPLEVSTLPCEVTVDVHLTITVTGNDVKMVTLDTQDAGNLIKIGGKNATKELLGGSYWNDAEEMVPAKAADGTTPAAFAVNTKSLM